MLLTKYVISPGIKVDKLVPVPNILERDITCRLVGFPAFDQIDAIGSFAALAVFI